MPGVFISYRRQDTQHLAGRLYDRLRDHFGRLTSTDTRGRRRLDTPDDYVCLELEATLNRQVRVKPVLVDRHHSAGIDRDIFLDAASPYGIRLVPASGAEVLRGVA